MTGWKPPRKTGHRRIYPQRLPGRDQFGSRVESDTSALYAGSVEAWTREVEQLLSSPFKTHPIFRLTENGIDYGAKPGPGDEIGYGMEPHRYDDCFQAAIATATQVPIEQVPDLGIDKQLRRGVDPHEVNRRAWERVDDWASRRGFTALYWENVPVQRRRWIGVVVVDPALLGQSNDTMTFADHCLVMSHDRLVFDPICAVMAPPGQRLATFSPTDITYGISFDRKER